MKILDYDEVNPLQVLHLTMLALDFPLTPEHAAHIRHTDPRPFPCFTVNAVEDDVVLGQVGVFQLPMISTEGREDVGGVWAVSTHPNHAGRGIASALLDEAHTRMRDAGLRFSTLGTDRSRVSYRLYQRHGYIDMNVWATALTRWETAHQPTHLRARPPGSEGYDFVENYLQTSPVITLVSRGDIPPLPVCVTKSIWRKFGSCGRTTLLLDMSLRTRKIRCY
jgi:GNAT superfamily N-acetyltransferase